MRKRLPHVLDLLAQPRPTCFVLQETKVQDSDFPARLFSPLAITAPSAG